jgi:hypothetical protein
MNHPGIEGHSAFAYFCRAPGDHHPRHTIEHDHRNWQIDLLSLPTTGVQLGGYHFSK